MSERFEFRLRKPKLTKVPPPPMYYYRRGLLIEGPYYGLWPDVTGLRTAKLPNDQTITPPDPLTTQPPGAPR